MSYSWKENKFKKVKLHSKASRKRSKRVEKQCTLNSMAELISGKRTNLHSLLWKAMTPLGLDSRIDGSKEALDWAILTLNNMYHVQCANGRQRKTGNWGTLAMEVHYRWEKIMDKNKSLWELMGHICQEIHSKQQFHLHRPAYADNWPEQKVLCMRISKKWQKGGS